MSVVDNNNSIYCNQAHINPMDLGELPFADSDFADEIDFKVNPIPFTLVNNRPLDGTEFVAPYVPCASQTIHAALDFAGISEHDVLVDLGCGDGRILSKSLELSRPPKSVIGVELDPHLSRYIRETVILHLGKGEYEGNNHELIPTNLKLSEDRSKQKKFKLLECDMFSVDLGSETPNGLDATVLVLYLLPAGLEKLKPQFREWLEEYSADDSNSFFDFSNSIKSIERSELATEHLKKSSQSTSGVLNFDENSVTSDSVKVKKRICTITYSISGWEPVHTKKIEETEVNETGPASFIQGSPSKRNNQPSSNLSLGLNLGIAGTAGISQWLFYYDVSSIK
ncbi:hypothetical protein HK096_005797 [Nowakowskiella sp. JEL0078]|nr:hypothetical protein HK096_005797 [Nowakowskiella sp. JEL0078]